jgi:hypothetical protein
MTQLRSRAPADLPAHEGHDDQVVAGEELSATYDDQDKAEGEDQSAQQALLHHRAGCPVPARTVVQKMAPTPMKAPARMPSTNIPTVSSPAFFTPIPSAFEAIAGGSKESNEIWSVIVSFSFF